MKKLSRFPLFGGLSLLLAAAGCQREPDAKACSDICTKLDKCGMLPSALGSGSDKGEYKAYCEIRCGFSSSPTRENIEFCVESVDSEGGAKWCEDNAACRQARDCLLESFPPEIPVVGQGEISVDFGAGETLENDDAESSSMSCGPPRFKPGDEGRLSRSDDSVCTANESELFCSALNLSTVQLFAVQRETSLRLPSRSCPGVIAAQSRFTGLLPGPVRVGARLRGACPTEGCLRPPDSAEITCDSAPQAPEPGPTMTESKVQPWCFVVYAEDVIVSAAEPQVATVRLPSAQELGEVIDRIVADPSGGHADLFVCEETPATCADGRDNDGDGHADCADGDCAVFCSEDSDVRCQDGLDNDGDGSIDCKDPDCAGVTACIEALPDASVDAGELAGGYPRFAQPYNFGVE